MIYISSILFIFILAMLLYKIIQWSKPPYAEIEKLIENVKINLEYVKHSIENENIKWNNYLLFHLDFDMGRIVSKQDKDKYFRFESLEEAHEEGIKLSSDMDVCFLFSANQELIEIYKHGKKYMLKHQQNIKVIDEYKKKC